MRLPVFGQHGIGERFFQGAELEGAPDLITDLIDFRIDAPQGLSDLFLRLKDCVGAHRRRLPPHRLSRVVEGPFGRSGKEILGTRRTHTNTTLFGTPEPDAAAVS